MPNLHAEMYLRLSPEAREGQSFIITIVWENNLKARFCIDSKLTDKCSGISSHNILTQLGNGLFSLYPKKAQFSTVSWTLGMNVFMPSIIDL